MKILFVCTSNKDRSPALEAYFSEVYPDHQYRSAGVNEYFTGKHGTHYLTVNDICWADIIVYAEDVHYDVACEKFPGTGIGFKDCLVLRLGEYREGQLGEDYLMAADRKLSKHLVSQ
jgi:predicted protein tyrosine phosphatase